jgi:hypothetical protein
MKFYHRYDEDGICEVICTRCFLTLGSARELIAIKDLEARHACGKNARSRQSASELYLITPPKELFEKAKVFNACAFFAAIILSLYLFPTMVEIGAARIFNPWVAIILPGDAMGCLFLMTTLRMRWLGLCLYVLLTICESSLYGFRIIAPGILPWITDIIPTLLAGGLMLRSRFPGMMRLRPSS